MRKPRQLTRRERDRLAPWLETLAAGDTEVLRLLWLSLGRIAVGILEATLEARHGGGVIKMGDPALARAPAGWGEAVAAWLRSAIEHDDAWLCAVDADGSPVRLMRCETYSALLDEARTDFVERKYPMPRP